MRRFSPLSNILARWALLGSLLLLPCLFVGCGGSDGDGSSGDDIEEGSPEEDDSDGGDGDGQDGDNEDGNTGSGDFGDNDPNLMVAIGDSITAGTMITGPSYPSRLAGILGKNVKNRAVTGARSSAAGGQAAGALALKPGYLLIMFGTNDVFEEISSDVVAGNIANVIQMARAQKTIPVVATIPPNLKNEFQADFVASYNNRIKSVARSGGARLANVNAEFGSGAGLIQEDGYHPNETGTQVIAYAFADAIR